MIEPMKKLLIVESPGKIKKIRSFLPREWVVKASVGHVRDLPAKSLGIVFDSGKVALDYEVVSGKKKTVSDLKKAASEALEIYLAMDMDREGEAIAWHVGMLLGQKNWPKIKRVAFTEITKKAVLQALSLPRRVDSHLVSAQQARRAVDRLVGFKVSPLLWRQKGLGNSAGRVQSVAVRLVVEREREIRHFKPQEFWRIQAKLSPQGHQEPFWAELVEHGKKKCVSKIDEKKKEHQKILSTEQQAKELIQEFSSHPFVVLDQGHKKEQRRPYPPFITSTLQQAASTKLKWPAKKAMQVAQKLYEKGLITYMRTDAPAISQEALGAVRNWIQEQFPGEYLPKKAHQYSSKVQNAQEAHECIRPTDVRKDPSQIKEDPDLQQLYTLIWKQFVACQMAPAQFQVVSVELACGEGVFRAKGRRMLFDGWMKLMGVEKEKGEKAPELLPPLSKGEQLQCHELKPSQHHTQPPKRYTEATLIKELEKLGIGRPSTYAAILENIRRRGYITETKRMLAADHVGEGLVDFLQKKFKDSFMDYAFTAQMEEALDRIARGELSWHTFVSRFSQHIAARV